MTFTNTILVPCLIILFLCAVIPILQAASRAAKEAQKEREQAARAAAQAEARRQEQEQKAAQQTAEKAAREDEKAARRRAAAEKRAEQKRKADQRAAIIRQKEQEKARKQAEKLEAARQLAEYNERALKAEKELKALRRETIPGAPQAAQKPEQEANTKHINPDPQPAAVSLQQFAAAHADSPKPFHGQGVSVTGKVPGMTQAQVLALVRALGGKTYDGMTTHSTILIVGDKPGNDKLNKADKWRAQKITAMQFYGILKAAKVPREAIVQA